MNRGVSYVIFIFLFSTLLLSCKVNDETPPPPATLTSIAISPASPAMAPLTTTQLTAIGTYSNNSSRNITTSVTWASSDIGIADISNSSGSLGLVTATSTTGSTVISATSSGITGSTTLTTSHVASIDVSPSAPPSIAPGTTTQFAATGTLSDSKSTQQNLTTWATWISADTGVAVVGNTGLALAVSAVTATTTIEAIYDGISGTATFQTSPLASIALSPISASIAKGTTQQFTATGTLVDSNTQILTTVATWSSSTTGVATISSDAGSQGLATAVSQGTATIVASFTSVTSPPATLTVTQAVITSITVTPVNPSIVLGKTEQFIAIGNFTDGTTQDISSLATWTSSNTAVATISNTSGSKGLVTSVAAGSTTITAGSGGGSGSTILTVTPAVLVSIEIIPAVASISLSSGIFTRNFAAKGHFSDSSTLDLTTSVTWSSSNTSVANISNIPGFQGEATGFSTGTADITASFSGITSTTAILIVNP